MSNILRSSGNKRGHRKMWTLHSQILQKVLLDRRLVELDAQVQALQESLQNGETWTVRI